MSSRQGSRDARVGKASPKPGIKKTVSGNSAQNTTTPNRNQSRGKVRPAGAGSAARLKSGARVGSRQGTGSNQAMSTGPTSTGLVSQHSGEQPMVRTTMKD